MGKAKKTRSGKKAVGTRGQKVTTRAVVSAAEQLKYLEASVRNNPKDIQTALTLAHKYLNSGQEVRIVEILSPLAAQYPFGEPLLKRRYDLLLAFGYAHLNRLSEAEEVIRRAQEESPMTPDLLYVLCYVKLSLREYDRAIEAASMYLKARETQADGEAGITASDGHLSQLYNFMGGAFREEKKLQEATACYEKAIAADAGNHLPYLNLANLYLQMNERKAAAEVIARGLKLCRQIQELRMLEEGARNQASVSACMIVKNEEEQLGRCLESIRDWVDEIIVVDTGSTDRTVEIAQSYGVRIFHQAWEGDFSKHRNFSLEKASSDWIFVIDADEEFCREDLGHLRALLSQPQCRAVSINVYNVYPHERTTTFLPSIRFFRTDLKLRYDGIVHNNLQIPSEIAVHRARVRLNHYGYDLSPEKMKAKAARTKLLLEKQLAENPNNTFALFNYAQVLRGEGDDSREVNAPVIIRSALKAVDLTNPAKPTERSIHLMCLDQLAWTYFYLKDDGKAIEYARRALSLKANYLDPMLLLGHVYARRHSFSEAVAWYNRYLDAQSKYIDTTESDNIILIHVDSRVTAYYSLAAIAEMQGQFHQAKHYYRLTTSINAQHLEANLALGRLLLAEGNLVEAESCFMAQLEATPESTEALLGSGYIAFQRKDLAAARRCYQSVIQLDPNNATALLKLGQICMQESRESEAAQCFQMALDAGSSELSVERQLAEIYFDSGRYAEAAKCYDHLLSRTTPTSDLYNDLGNCYFRMNRLDAAEQYYEKALSTAPVSALPFRNLGVTLAKMGRVEEALKALERYLGAPDAQFDIHRIVGDLYLQMGKYREGIGHFEEYLAKDPTDPQALYSLSECYLQLGHRDSAAMGFQRVLQLQPGYVPAQERLDQLQEAEARV